MYTKIQWEFWQLFSTTSLDSWEAKVHSPLPSGMAQWQSEESKDLIQACHLTDEAEAQSGNVFFSDGRWAIAELKQTQVF